MKITRPRILHLVLSLNVGGMERLLASLSGTAEMKSFDQFVCCLDELGALAPDLERNGAKVFLKRRRPGFDFRLVFELARFLRRERIDVIHTHALDPMLYAALASLIARVPVRVHTQHSASLGTCGFGERWKFRIAAWFFTHLVAVSQQAQRGMLRSGAPVERTRTIRNGIAFHPAASAHTQRQPGPGLVIGSVGRLVPEKAIDRLIRAFAHVHRRYPDTVLRIIGDGPERSALERLARDLGIASSVVFPGYTADVPVALQKLDIFVLPSLTEGIPLALLEAMAARLPVIATEVGGVPEVVVNRSSGLLIPPDNVEALANVLEALIRDGALRASLAENAEQRVEQHFSLSAMAARYRSLYWDDPPSKPWEKLGKSVLQCLPEKRIAWRSEARSGVALTFDDGPDAYTPRILDILKRFEARATFFLVGERAARNPEVVQRIIQEGHEIGNHSFSHPDFDGLSLHAAGVEVDRTQSVLEEITGSRCRWFRPPKGKLCPASLLAAWRKGLSIAMWNVDVKDFRAAQAEDIVAQLERETISAGDIVLYHGNNDAALAALPRLIERARAAGRPLAPLSELMEGEGRS